MRLVLKTSCVAAMVGAIVSAVGVRQASAAGVAVDPRIANYEKVSGVAGNLSSVGSDTLNNLMTYWAEGFRKLYPNVKIQIEGKGSATAPPALTEGTAQMGPMSRKMKPEEEDAFERKRGFKPTRISVALDCVAVYVHRDNPVRGLTLAQVDCIFSKTHKSGFRKIATWGEAGVKHPAWARLPISIYGRNSASGTYAFFKKKALLKGDYKDTVKEQPGSAAVVNGVARDRVGIGYSGIGYKTSEVRAIALSKTPTERLAEPTFENALAGKYPLGRTLYVYVSKSPNEPLATLTKEFVKFILSKKGQEIVIKDGYGPLPAAAIEKQMKLLD